MGEGSGTFRSTLRVGEQPRATHGKAQWAEVWKKAADGVPFRPQKGGPALKMSLLPFGLHFPPLKSKSGTSSERVPRAPTGLSSLQTLHVPCAAGHTVCSMTTYEVILCASQRAEADAGKTGTQPRCMAPLWERQS